MSSRPENETEAGSTPGAAESYHIGDVGAGARVMQGKNQQMLEIGASRAAEESLVQRLTTLSQRIAADPGLDEDTRDLAVEKTRAVAEQLARAGESPQQFRRALKDAHGWLSDKVGWAWEEMRGILSSEAAQKVLGTIAEATTKEVIHSLLGGG
jgi:hypothetical protein